MPRGAIAICDALGFKGIWADNNLEAVIKKLNSVSQGIERLVPGLAPELWAANNPCVKVKCEVRFLSDSVVIATSTDARQKVVSPHGVDSRTPKTVALLGWGENEEALLLEMCCRGVQFLISEGARDPIPLAYRGSIAFGDFMIEGNFMVGKAVDEAADLSELADGAFVWLAPSAQSVVHPTRVKRHSTEAIQATNEAIPAMAPLVEYDVPLKDGRSVRCPTIDPFAFNFESGVEQLLSRFDGSRLDVLIKRQNTEKFLNAVKAQNEHRWRTWRANAE